MNFFSHTSLAKKMTLSAISMMAGSIIIITAVVYMTVLSFGEKFLENDLNQKSEFIQKAFTDPIWTYDQYQINQLANSLLVDNEFTYITALKIESTDEKILFEKTQDELKNFSYAAQMPYTKNKQFDIIKENQKIGKISVVMTNIGYIRSLQYQLAIILIASIILIFLTSQLALYYFNQTLISPLNKILHQVQMIENGNYNTQEFTELPAEFESISKALNHASRIIEKRDSDIKYYTNDLEKLVRERTAELEDQMAKNIATARLAAVGEMATNVAHEINNPLTVIDLHVTKLKKAEEELPKNLEESISKIQLMTMRINKIIKGLKSLSRDGNADPKEPFFVSSMIEDVKTLVDMKVKSHDIVFTVEIENSSLQALGREVQISQVLVNLIGNAVDAIATSEIKDKWIKLQVREQEDDIYFYVTDGGTGIPLDLQEKIMRPFFTTKEVNKGTGLGLSISKNIIEEHGGYFQYNSSHNNTQFIFTLKKVKNIKHIA